MAPPTTPAWEDLATAGPSLPRLEEHLEADVCVVGLGGSGLAALAELVRRGVDAVGIDAGGIAAGAAGRNGGFLLGGLAAFHHDAVERLGEQRATDCFRATLEVLDELCDEMPDAVRRLGSVRVAVDENELADCQLQLRAMAAAGLAVEEWEGGAERGLFFPPDASFNPTGVCRAVSRRILSGGGRLFGASPVQSVQPESVSTAAGSVACRRVLVCVDGRLDQLLPELFGIVRSARLQMLGTAPLGRVVAPRPVYSRYGYDYWHQAPSGEVLLGGGRDRGGEAEWTDSDEVTPEVQSWLDERLGVVVGAESPPRVTRRWAGIVGYTASGMPVVRRLASGVLVAGGYCGTGNLVGRLAGRALVELALDGRSRLAELLDGPD